MKLLSAVTNLGCLGIFKFRNGEEFCTLIIKEDDDRYSLRFEDGWYEEFYEDGTKVSKGELERDIIHFEKVESSDPRIKKLQWGAHP